MTGRVHHTYNGFDYVFHNGNVYVFSSAPPSAKCIGNQLVEIERADLAEVVAFLSRCLEPEQPATLSEVAP